MAFATPVHAQDAGSGTPDLPNIKWSLSGETSVQAPPKRRAEAPAIAAPARPYKVTAAKPPVAKTVAVVKPARAVVQKPPAPVRTAAKAPPPPKPGPRPAMAQVRALPPKPPAAKPLPILASPPVALRPSAVAAKPPPIAVQRQPMTPPPDLGTDSDLALVTTHPLPPRNASEEGGSFGEAVASAARHTSGLPTLRPVVGFLSLAAALLALVAIWWQSLGARMWGVRRRNTQPRLMIDIALAEESPISTLAMTEIVRDRETA
jgi:hypothetical protein